MSELEEVSQLSEDTAGHYEAVLQILEGYKEECVELKGFNEQQKSELNGLQAENEGLKDQLCVLQDEVQMRTDVVDKLHSMMATMPAAVDAKEHSEVIRKAAYFEEQHNETAKLLKPLQNKLHQQEKYISRLETQVSAHTTAARQTQDTISHMTAEVMRTKHKYATDLKHNRQYCRKLLAKTECLNMEKEDIRHRSELQAIRTEEVKAEFIQHAESVVRLKEEQIKLLRSDVQHKDSQLQESKTIIKDMMGSLRDTMEQTTTLRLEKEEVQSKFAEASARVNELESMNETAKDTRKQVRREVQGVLAQAKETEQQWSKDKVKCEELIAKQRSKIQTLTTQKNKLEEAAAEQRGNLKKSTERIQGTTAAIERAFSQICGSPHIEQLEIHIGGGDNLNCRQKLQNMIKAATEATLQALRFKSSSTTATQQLDEVREHCKAIESHAGWLEAEWGACKERKESIEEECKKIREEGFAANKQNRELVASNEVMKDKLAKLENAVAVQNDALNEKDTLGQVATAEVVTLKAELDVAQTSTRQYEEQLEELPLLRERIHELTMEQEALGQDRMSSEKDKETLIKEKEQIYEAKMKHQKNTAKYLAELKKVRSEVAELKKKLETSVKATEQLRKQVCITRGANTLNRFY